MTKAHRLLSRKQKAVTKTLPLNFLLGCGQKDLADFELNRLAEIADLRRELHAVLDRVIDATAQAALAGWFKVQDRQTLKHAIENEETPIEMAKRLVRERQRSAEELVPRSALEPGVAHRAAALKYQARNLSEGKCISCPEPLASNSKTYCEKHLRAHRLRYKPKNAKGALPGTVGWLHGEGFESQHGRMPGTLQSLANSRQKRNRAILAELGLPLGSVATALQAAKEKLIKHVPYSENDGAENEATTARELFLKAGLSEMRATAKKALQQLVDEGKIQHIKTGGRNKPFLYFRGVK